MFNPMKMVTMGADLVAGGMANSSKNKANRKQRRALEQMEKELYSPINVPVSTIAEESDPRAVAAQRMALERYISQMSEDGLTPEDQLHLAEIADEQREVEQGQREAILADARAKGMGLSGATLGAQLGASQAAASNARTAGLRTAALGQIRRRDATDRAAALGLQRQQAQDNINRFNAMQKLNRFDNQLTLADKKAGLRTGRINLANQHARERIGGNLGLYQNFMSNFGGGNVGGGGEGGGGGGMGLDFLTGLI